MKKAKIAILIGMILSLIAIIFAILFYFQLQNTNIALEDAQQKLKAREKLLILYKDSLSKSLGEIAGEYIPKRDSAKLTEIRSLLQSANNFQENSSITYAIIDSLLYNTKGTREDITVEVYFDKTKGQDLGRILESADYEIVWKESVNTTPINSIWYDDDTSIENVKLIASLIIRSGYAIKLVKKRLNTNGNTQIGSSPRLVSSTRIYTIEDIERLK